MKRRKAPILLVSLLVLLAAGGVGYKMYMDAPQGPQAMDPSAQPHDAPSASDVGSQVADATTMKTKGASQGVNRPVIPGSGGPSIAIDTSTNKIPKPKPNPSGTTASHWYDNN